VDKVSNWVVYLLYILWHLVLTIIDTVRTSGRNGYNEVTFSARWTSRHQIVSSMHPHERRKNDRYS